MPMCSLPKDAKYRIVLSENLERKIRTYCALSPEREWSGVMFYTFEGDFERGVTIHANDMYLMDQGTHVHTEFGLNEPEITRYMFLEGLTDHCMALLHSHCSFNAFFSGEDASTLYTYGMEMNNFVSLVVNNAGQYVARLTRKVTFDGEQKTILQGSTVYKLFNTNEEKSQSINKEEARALKDTWVEYVDLEIVKPNIGENFDTISRFGIINHKCSKENTVIKDNLVECVKLNNLNTLSKQEKQGTLWDNDELDTFTRPEELEMLAWKKHGYDKWFSLLLNGSPFDDSARSRNALDRMYMTAFKQGTEDFALWFEFWLDYMVSVFDTSWIEDDELDFDGESLLLMKVSEDIEKLNLEYNDTIQQIISTRLM